MRFEYSHCPCLSRIFLLTVVFLIIGGCAGIAGRSNSLFIPDIPTQDEVSYTLPHTSTDDDTITLWAVGKGAPPDYAYSDSQAAILAERAAIADAYRQLAEKIHGVYIESHQKVRNMALDDDHIRIAMRTWLRGAEIVNVEHNEDETAKVEMKVKIRVNPRQKNKTMPRSF